MSRWTAVRLATPREALAELYATSNLRVPSCTHCERDLRGSSESRGSAVHFPIFRCRIRHAKAGTSQGGAHRSSRTTGDARHNCSRDSNAIVGVFDLHTHVAATADVARRFDLVGQPDAFDATKSFVDVYLRNP